MNITHRIVRRYSTILRDAIMFFPTWRLQATNAEQRERFARFALDFHTLYESVADVHAAVLPVWKKYTDTLAAALLPIPAWDFLRNRTLAESMVIDRRGENFNAELSHLREWLGDSAVRPLIVEDPCGHPRIANAQYMTSHSCVHNAYHIARFSASTGINPRQIRSVVEWGGGYGLLAKLWRRLSASPPTWVIVDLPLLSALQWLYLSSTLGPDSVQLITRKGQTILDGRINLIPVHLHASYRLQPELFVSTWAISESPLEIQEQVIGSHWFGAQHLLLAFQDTSPAFPTAGLIASAAQRHRCSIESIPGMKAQHYAFR